MSGGKEHDAIVLRFFNRKELRQIGAAMGTTEDAARMRINRAIEKLREFFTKRGVTLSATAITGAVAANSVQAAPAGLAAATSSGNLACDAGVSKLQLNRSIPADSAAAASSADLT